MSKVYLYSGGFLNLEDPDFRAVNLEDIAIPLSRISRFNGHTAEPWNVAQHSVLTWELARLFMPEMSAHMILHDAHEAFIGDITRPVKGVLGKEARMFETKFMSKFFKYMELELNTYILERMKILDNIALSLEAQALMKNTSWVHESNLPTIRLIALKYQDSDSDSCISSFRYAFRKEFPNHPLVKR